jgi:hypothetical protein
MPQLVLKQANRKRWESEEGLLRSTNVEERVWEGIRTCLSGWKWGMIGGSHRSERYESKENAD